MLVVQFYLALSPGNPFNEMCKVTKGAWLTDKAKENCGTIYTAAVLCNYH